MANNNLANVELHSKVEQHCIFAFVVGTLNSLSQVKYQAGKVSAFDQYKCVTTMLVIALFTYGTASVAEVAFQAPAHGIYLKVIKSVRRLATGLTIASLVFVLAPILGWIFFGFLAFLFAKEASESYREVYEILHQGAIKVLDKSKEILDIIKSHLIRKSTSNAMNTTNNQESPQMSA